MVNECGQLPQTSAAAASGGASPTDCSSPRSRPTNAFCIVDPLTASNRLSDSLKHIAIRFNGRRRGLPCAGAEAADGPADGGDRIADVGDAGVWIRAWRQKSRDSPCRIRNGTQKLPRQEPGNCLRWLKPGPESLKSFQLLHHFLRKRSDCSVSDCIVGPLHFTISINPGALKL